MHLVADNTVHGNEQRLSEAYRRSMREHFRSHAEGTNINTSTLLTTDYLNHFSSIMMLLEMMPAAPEDFAGEIFSWEPKSYLEHFEESGFRDRDLAVAAYEHAPEDVREAFDSTVEELQDLSLSLIDEVRKSMEEKRLDNLNEVCAEGVTKLRDLIDQAAHIVNGGKATKLENHVIAETGQDGAAAQNLVDTIFD